MQKEQHELEAKVINLESELKESQFQSNVIRERVKTHSECNSTRRSRT